MKTIHKFALALLLATTSTSCATIIGTAVSPVTGGVDLARRHATAEDWYYMPPIFLGGAIAGPFVAIFNGLEMDFDQTGQFTSEYSTNFHQIFRPFTLLAKTNDSPKAKD